MPLDLYEISGIIVLILVLVVLSILRIKGIFDIFSWVSKHFDLRKREKRIEELEEVNMIRKENLEKLSSMIWFRISYLAHTLKIPAPSVDLQVNVHNDSVFNVRLKKFIYQPRLLGIRGSLSEFTYDHEMEIPHQNSKYFETKFIIPEGIATYLENCKRRANAGEHGKLTWDFSCTAYLTGPKGEFTRHRTIQYTKEWYEIEC